MTFQQESIWLNDQFQGGRSRYVESWAHRIRGRLDIDAVESALSELVRRHEGLRSRLHLEADRPVQTVLPARPVTVGRRRIPVHRMPDALREALTETLSLDDPPLLRAWLFEPVGEGIGATGQETEDEAVLVVTLHHAAMDGASLHLLDAEFSACYRAALAGTEPDLPAPERQVGPYAARQRRADRLMGSAHLAHWQAAMSGAPQETGLPADRPRPAVLSHRGGDVRFTLDETVSDGVRSLAERLRTTPFVVLLAALTALTQRLNGQEDLVIGTPVSLRDEPELDSMIACMAEVLPLRQRVSPTGTFADLVSATQDVVLDAVEHRDVSFSRLVAELGVERTLSRFPLFQIVFTADHRGASGLDLPGATAEWITLHNGTSKYDLFLNLVPEGRSFRGVLEYSADLYDHETAQRLAERYRVLLADAVLHPERELGDLSLLPEAERDVIQNSWTSGPLPDGTLSLAHEVVVEQARLTPDAPAVLAGPRTLTYRELDTLSDALAASLVEQGHAGSRVALCAERSLGSMIAVLATLKAGCASVPLDPGYPAERLAHMALDSGCTAVVGRPSVIERMRLPDSLPVISLDESMVSGPATDRKVPLPKPGPDDLAYVLYTSGSTGLPKGVAMPHRSLAGLVDWQRHRSGCGDGSRTLQFAPLSFDVSFQELFSTWASGGAVVLVENEVRGDPERLLDALSEHRIDRIFLPYVALHQLARYACAEERLCPTLKEVVTAGEQLFVTSAIRRFFADLTDAWLENQYGPTETHVVTAERLTGPPSEWPERPAIGRPVPGARVYVLDGRMRPRPIGAVGELYVGGTAPAQGYLGLPRLTAERFVRDPCSAHPGPVYRTGDLARVLPDGRIEFVGRTDDQVKVRGHRVEIGEVESAVKAVPGVKDAVVVTDDAAPGDGLRLIAGYLPAAAGGATPEDMRAALHERLPSFMVPTGFVQLDSFPMTPSGKVDRAAISRPRQAPAPPPVAPDGHEAAAVQRIRAVYAEVLGVCEVGHADDFFAHGGDSLLAVRLALALRAELDVKVPMNAVFTAPTPAAMSVLVDRLGQRPDLPGLADDVVLPADVAPAAEVVSVVRAPRQVLLTGATGFLGAFLLRELIDRTAARVHCLVRGADNAQAAGRLRATLERYGIRDEETEDRIVVHAGDLSVPRLGLPDQTYELLAREADVVYHAGAAVNLAQSYAQSRGANVVGTVEVLRLAAARRTVPVHHVSTVGVFSGPDIRGRRIGPDTPLTPVEGLMHGYTQSKWVAEQLVETARARGLPVTVYRPTRIAGDTSTGACQDADFLWLLLKGCVQAGLAPVLPGVAFDLVPVDYLSRAVVALSRHPGAAGRNVHLSGEQLLPFGSAVDGLRGRGYRLRDVPLPVWVRAVEQSPDNAAFPLLGVLGMDGHDDDPEGSTRYDSGETARLLTDTGITCPDIDEKLFTRYVQYFVESGFLPSADHEGARR
ncbi:non-ribosomal peptide synthetase [Streptomyces sp. HD]|uniref:non-ribosomal peptide synthetase n=1 Tax=Streptomyces sp. HD TaxID=3020892 RepID=UPI002330E430|nr:amino acid adenylation domain-containing protein [Streptomyces sp. HD]MDC0773368.1 amino acid adenylation domain-containing protein [Streptomyces sp. HD]